MRHYYPFFFRNHGAWKVQHLVEPRIFALNTLELPRNSLVHILPDSSESVVPDKESQVLQGWQKPISLYNVLELVKFDGNPRRVSYDANSDFNKFMTQNNQQFRRHKEIAKPVPDDQALIALSYCALSRLYYYATTNYSAWDEYYNLMNTVIATAESYAQQSNRNQFIILDAPALVPSQEFLRNAERAKDIDQKIVKDFNTPGRRLVLELYKWIGSGYRQNSIFSKISLANLKKINLIIKLNDTFTVLNLGLLDEWRSSPKGEKDAWEFYGKSAGSGMQPLNYQRVILRFFLTLTKIKSVSIPSEELDAEMKEDHLHPGEPAVAEQQKAELEKVAAVSSPATPPKLDVMDQDFDEEALDDKLPKDIQLDAHIEKELDEELKLLEHLNNRHYTDAEPDEAKVEEEVLPIAQIGATTALTAIQHKCDQLADKGMLSVAEYKRHIRLSESYKKLTIDGIPMEKLLEDSPETYALQEPKPFVKAEGVKDERMLKSSISQFDKEYNKNGHLRAIASVALSIQKAGVSLVDLEKERVNTVMGSSDVYSLRLVPVEGEPSTIKIRLPVIDDTGQFVANGTKYRLRRQKGDLPIRKISPNEVALSSYYGAKLFVTRAARKNNDYGEWLSNQIRAKGLDPEDKDITNLHTGNVFDHQFSCVRIYSMLALRFSSFKIREFDCTFDHQARVEIYGQDALDTYEGKSGKIQRIIFGKSADGRYLVFGEDGMVYVGENKLLRPNGSFEQLIGLKDSFGPNEQVDVRVIDKNIPLGVILAYELGFERMIKALGVKHEVQPGRVRTSSLSADQFCIKFSDATYIFQRDDRYTSMILAGFQDYSKFTIGRTVREFNSKEVYLPMLESRKLTLKYLNEIENLFDLFIDPITETLLEQMKEPTNFRGLLLRAAELLLNDQHPTEMDTEFQRLKGNERIVGAMYRELARSIRRQRSRVDRFRAPIELKPHAVWQSVMDDSAKLLVDESNPIEHLKEVEAVTFSGTGGRASETMVARTRLYSKKDMGVISEAGVDSGDVGVNIWTSANPNLTSIFGTTKPLDGDMDPTKLFSTSTLLAPFADKEDMKRAIFTGIQNKHTVPCDGYKAPAVRTGYEYVVPHRVGDLFCTTAKQPGTVESITEKGIIVKYKDGTIQGIELGRRFGISAGSVVPHYLETNMRPGQKFDEGDVIAYNSKFFELDYFNPKAAVLKFNTTAKIGLFEHALTEEDSSLISPALSSRMGTEITHLRTVVVSFKDNLVKIVQTGDKLTPNDVLCYIHPEVAASATGIDDPEALAALTEWSRQTPKAKYPGVVERVECYYHGILDDMSPSVRKLAEISDKELKARNKAAGKPVYGGMVDDSYRLEGEAIPLDSMAINFYITVSENATTGDKLVFGNQLKTVIGEVFNGSYVTESGVELEGIFGQASIDDRIIDSLPRIGGLTTLLKLIATKTVSAYHNL